MIENLFPQFTRKVRGLRRETGESFPLQIAHSRPLEEDVRIDFMTRMSTVLLLILSLPLGCTSDQLGFRSTYRDRNVTPWANPQPVTNAPVAMQPGGGPPLGPPVGVSQSMILPQAAMSNYAMAQQRARTGWNSPYPMLASNGGQIDGRSYPYMRREVVIPGPGGAKAIKTAVRSSALAGGVASSPQEDLKYRGGHTIKDLNFVNIYVGGSDAWAPTDWQNIDKALASAMADQNLNNVIMQYFNNNPVSAKFVKSFFYGWKPKLVQKTDMDVQVQILDRQHAFDNFDLPNTVFNFILPRGTILGDPSGGQQQKVANKAIPLADAEDSTGGLGGYHGCAHLTGKTVYYAVGVFSERLQSGGTNGIPVFDQNWKNVVATFYHELQEARTDADVDDAATSPNGMAVLGWTSDSGNEIGDYPIAEATQLLTVFKEIPLADGSGTVPVQFIYSNAVHGPEGPIPYPHGMEPGSGNTPPNNQPPNNPPPNNQPSTSTPPELTNLLSNWGQLEDWVKKAILKLAS